MLNPYPYQNSVINGVYDTWNQGAVNVGAVLPTGGGKTVVFSNIVHQCRIPTVIIAHRQEIVHQISLALAHCGVYHKIIGPDAVIKMAVRSHMKKFNAAFYDPSSPFTVAGVDTLVRRYDTLKSWGETIKLWILDECHHLLRSNKWGKAVSMFPNARGLGVTATPTRADGYGLGRSADGVIDQLVIGPSMRDLIDQGYLTPYRILGPFTRMDLSDVGKDKSGDFNRRKLKIQVRKSTIVGDVVKTYIERANGLLGLTFATDVETATDFAKEFNENGVPAEVITAKTPTAVREEVFDRFQNRDILQVVNVDILGEGFDCPAIEVVSFARPTLSYVLYCQQFGRALRPMPGNPDKVALILDHVGNVITHKLPDGKMRWTLDRRDRKSNKNDGMPVRVCPQCTFVYESINKICPACGFYPEPQSRSGPEFVDGDLTEMTPEIIAVLCGEIDRIDMPPRTFRDKLMAGGGMARGAVLGATKKHELRQVAQKQLREIIALWAGHQRAKKRSDSESYRRFYYTFGYDVLTAQTLGRPAAEDLKDRVIADLREDLLCN